MIKGTIFPVWYLGKHEGIVLEGLGGKTDDPVRPGCSGLFRSIIGCGAWVKIPGFPTFKISGNGVPIPQEPTEPVEPGASSNDENPDDPDDSDDQDSSAEITSRAHDKTSAGTSLSPSQSRFRTADSTGPSSSHQTTQSVLSTNSSAYPSSVRAATSVSTKSYSSTASASATTINYIIRLRSDVSTSQLENIMDDVKGQAPNMYSIALGSRPNDTVICAKLNGSSLAQFNNDPLVSSSPISCPPPTRHFCTRRRNDRHCSVGLLSTSGPESHTRTRSARGADR